MEGLYDKLMLYPSNFFNILWLRLHELKVIRSWRLKAAEDGTAEEVHFRRQDDAKDRILMPRSHEYSKKN